MAITICLANGMPIERLSNVVGHSNIKKLPNFMPRSLMRS